MVVLFANDYKLHDPKYEVYDGRQEPYAEKPERITQLLEACLRMGFPVEEVTEMPELSLVESLHDTKYISYLRNKSESVQDGAQLMPSVFIRDTYTPLVRRTYQAALKSAGISIAGAEKLLAGQSKVYALCRPPGHHAESNSMGGYCYFNNAGLAANILSKHGKVAILDIDYHHGNGTQSLFYDRSDVLYVSLHADPSKAFPYISGFPEETGLREGQGFTHNFALAPDIKPHEYLQTLAEAANRINDFEPDYVILSLGFDTYKEDPIAGLGLGEDDYQSLGEVLASNLDQPTLIVQEGGYNAEMLGKLAEKFFKGYLGRY
jgi:acetoin utilization deacetylase AcuC-like enzyme